MLLVEHHQDHHHYHFGSFEYLLIDLVVVDFVTAVVVDLSKNFVVVVVAAVY